jgi:ATP-dependent RNA helicase DDX35
MADFSLDASFIPALHKPAALLPIAKHRDSLLYVIETCPVTIVIGHTGSGKTTQIPQFLEKAGWCANGKVIGVTQVSWTHRAPRPHEAHSHGFLQPRRVAATTVALRVADEVGCEVGKEVGYSIRFEDVTSSATRIKFLTDGLLIREALVDPLLTRYSVIMVDEAHERSISTDVLLGLLKKIRRKRPDLRIIVSSATLQAEEFLRFFTATSEEKPPASNDDDSSAIGRIVSLEGRTYPIDILYLESPAENYVEKALDTVFDIHTQEGDGDILVFLTGREEIDNAIQAVAERISQAGSQYGNLLPLPLYAGLSSEEQMYVFDKTPEGKRKVIFSTNIAEASVTIDGIVYVIDCGFVKLRAYNPQTGIETLTATPTSKASASQRAGRAGRTKPGKCFRLYTEESYHGLPEANPPEIQRSNLAPIVLQLKALGIDNVVRFDYLSPPPSQLMSKALELLYSLGALDDYAKLTRPLGFRMAELAVEPMMAKTLLSAQSFNCLSEILTIAAMTSLGTSVWFYHDGEQKSMESSRRKFAAEEGDHLTLLNAYTAFVTKGKKEARFCHENHLNYKSMTRAVSIRAQLKRYLERFNIDSNESLASSKPSEEDMKIKAEQIRRCLTSGYFAQAARMQPDGTFRNIAGGTVMHGHPSSLMFNRKADWVIFHEIIETGEKTFIRDITKIEKGWLLEYAKGFYTIANARE